MRVTRKNGDPIKEARAIPKLAPSNRSISMDLYGFEDGPVQMRPDLLLEALFIGRGLSKAGIKSLKDLLKKGQTRSQKVAEGLFMESAKQAGEQTAQNKIMELIGLQ